MELLKKFGVKIVSRVIQIGKIKDNSSFNIDSIEEYELIERSPVRCLNKEVEEKMINEIDSTREIGDSLGGAVKVSALNVPVGLGSYAQYDMRIDGALAGALMSIQGVKGIEIGEGMDLSSSYGSLANDEIGIDCGRYKRVTNFAGGVEGGITNGMPLEATVYMKPIPTIKKSLRTVDLRGIERINRYERSDVCVIPALGVVCEHVLAFVIAKFFLEKFSGDSVEDITNSYNSYCTRLVRG